MKDAVRAMEAGRGMLCCRAIPLKGIHRLYRGYVGFFKDIWCCRAA